MTALLKSTPCEDCTDNQRMLDTGAWACMATLTGDPDCERYHATNRVSERAAQVAALIARETNSRLRSEEADQVAAAYDDVLSDLGAEFDYVAFMKACRASSDCARCRTRDLVDERHVACGVCEMGVAA